MPRTRTQRRTSQADYKSVYIRGNDNFKSLLEQIDGATRQGAPRNHVPVIISGKGYWLMLDSIPWMSRLPAGVKHRLDGTPARGIKYKAGTEADDLRKEQASDAVEVLGLDPQKYSGRIIEVRRNQRGEMYMLTLPIERKKKSADEENPEDNRFTSMNPSLGRFRGVWLYLETRELPRARTRRTTATAESQQTAVRRRRRA